MRPFHVFFLTCVWFIAQSASSIVEPSPNEVKPRSLFHSWWNPWSIFPIRGPRGEADISSSHTSANTLGGASNGHFGIGFTIDYGKNTEAGASHASSGITAEESIVEPHPPPDDLTQTGSDVPLKIKDTTSHSNLNHDLTHSPIIILDASTLLTSKFRDDSHQSTAQGGENILQTTPSIHQTAYHSANNKQGENAADDLTSAPRNQVQINDSKINLLIGLPSENKDFRATPDTVSESRVNFSSGNVMFEVQTKNHSTAQSAGQAKESTGNYVAQTSSTGKSDSLGTIYAALSGLAPSKDYTTPQFSSVSRSFVESSSNSPSTHIQESSSTIKDSLKTQNLTKLKQTEQIQVASQLKDGEDESSNRIFESTPNVLPFKRNSTSQSSILAESSTGNTNIQRNENDQTGLQTADIKDHQTPKIEISSIQPITGKPLTEIPSIQPVKLKPQLEGSSLQPNTGKLQTEISPIQPITGKPQLSSVQSTTGKATSALSNASNALSNSSNNVKISDPPPGLPWLRTHYYPVQANFWYPHNGPYHSYTTEYGPPQQEYGPPQQEYGPPQPQVYFTNDLYSATDGYNVPEPYYSPYKPPPKPIFTAAEYNNNDLTTYYSAYRPATKPVYLTKGTTPYRGVTIYLESDPDTTTQTPSTIYSANAVTTEKPSINSWFRPPQFLTNIISVLNKDNVGKPRDKVTAKPPTLDQKSA